MIEINSNLTWKFENTASRDLSRYRQTFDNVGAKGLLDILIETMQRKLPSTDIASMMLIHGDLQSGYINPYHKKIWPGNFYYDGNYNRLIVIDYDWSTFTNNTLLSSTYDYGFLLLSCFSHTDHRFRDSLLYKLETHLKRHNLPIDKDILIIMLLIPYFHRYLPRILEYTTKEEDAFKINASQRIEWSNKLFKSLDIWACR